MCVCVCVCLCVLCVFVFLCVDVMDVQLSSSMIERLLKIFDFEQWKVTLKLLVGRAACGVRFVCVSRVLQRG